MAILQTLYILFKANADEVTKTANKVKKSSKDLQTEMGDIESAGRKVGQAFTGLAEEFFAFVAAGLSAAAVLGGLKEAADYSYQLGTLARTLGVNVEELDAWSYAVQRAGGNAEEFQSSLKSLGEHLGGSPQIALAVLPQFADMFSRLGRFRAMQYGKSLGLDEHTIYLLMQGRTEVEKILQRERELGVVTDKNKNISNDFTNALFDNEHAWQMLYLTLDADILPTLTKLLNALTPAIIYLRQHKDLVEGFFIAVAAIGAAMIAPFVIAYGSILLVIAGLATLSAAFAVIYEDVKAFREGHNSLIGDILKKWPTVGKVVSAILTEWKILLLALIDPIKLIEDAFTKISEFFSGGGTKKIQLAIEKGASALGITQTTYVPPANANAILGNNLLFNTNRGINTGPINIFTQATDADGIAGAIGKSLDTHFDQVINTHADGVVA